MCDTASHSQFVGIGVIFPWIQMSSQGTCQWVIRESSDGESRAPSHTDLGALPLWGIGMWWALGMRSGSCLGPLTGWRTPMLYITCRECREPAQSASLVNVLLLRTVCVCSLACETAGVCIPPTKRVYEMLGMRRGSARTDECREVVCKDVCPRG